MQGGKTRKLKVVFAVPAEEATPKSTLTKRASATDTFAVVFIL